MRAGGINWLAVLAAAMAFYAVGFVIYGMLVPEETWMAWEGTSQAEIDSVGESRMPFGVVMPLMTAAFMAVLFKWGSVRSARDGAMWAIVVALASAIPAMLYAWVYGTGPIQITAVDSLHMLVGHAVAGAVIGGWR